MSWRWAILLVVTGGVIAAVLRLYRRDRWRSKARVRDVLSPAVAAELERERTAALRRKTQFAEAMRSAKSEQNR